MDLLISSTPPGWFWTHKQDKGAMLIVESKQRNCYILIYLAFRIKKLSVPSFPMSEVEWLLYPLFGATYLYCI